MSEEFGPHQPEVIAFQFLRPLAEGVLENSRSFPYSEDKIKAIMSEMPINIVHVFCYIRMHCAPVIDFLEFYPSLCNCYRDVKFYLINVSRKDELGFKPEFKYFPCFVLCKRADGEVKKVVIYLEEMHKLATKIWEFKHDLI